MAEGRMTAAGMVAAAKAEVENLSAETVAKEIQDGRAVLVDIRETEEDVAHLDGGIGAWAAAGNTVEHEDLGM